MTYSVSSAFEWARIRRLAGEGGWIVLGQIATVLGALVLVRMLTEHLNPTQYGQLALALTVAGLVNAVLMGWTASGITRFYSIAAEKQDLSGYLLASRRLLIYATAAVVAVGLMLMAGLLWLGYSRWLGLVLAVLVFSLFSGYNSAFSGIQNAARQRKIVAFHGGLDAWLKILLVFGMLLWLGKSSLAVAIGFALSTLFVTASQYIFLRRIIPVQTVTSGEGTLWMRKIWAYSWPFITWGIFGWAQQSSARWALESYSTTADVGRYAVLSQLGYSTVTTVTSFAITFLAPILFARASDTSSSARNEDVISLTHKLALVGVVLTGCACILAYFLHTYIFQLLTNENYHSVSNYLPWIVLSGGIFAVGQVYAMRLMALLKPISILLASVGSSIIGISSAFIGAYYLNLQGAIAATFIHAVSYLLLILLAVYTPSAKQSSNDLELL